MSNADKRSVATDALQTLGSIIGDAEKRDAIHLAVEPVTAAHWLEPGDHVGLVDGKAAKCNKPLGIVDPFLTRPIERGERFWLVVYPRQITSLRHVWEHPAFPASGETETVPSDDPVAASKAWIAAFAAELDQTVNRLMNAADEWRECGEWTYDNSETYKDVDDAKWPEFWRHYEVVTGKPVAEDERRSFFTCSC